VAIRINKFISDSGFCSRREADRLVECGRVTVDGVTASLGMTVTHGQDVRADGVRLTGMRRAVLIAVNKPKGIVCTAEKEERDNIVDFIGYRERIYPIGRLDKDSEGLILMTNDGSIVNGMMRARYGHEKEYIVTVNKPVTKTFLGRMSSGVPILGTVTKKCRTERIGNRTFRIVLTQGLNRQIRRMCGYLGYEVTALKRVRIMNIELGDLKEGEYRIVTEGEFAILANMIGDSRE